MWDEEVVATNSLKTMSPVTESGHESWLVDSGATTHVSINTIKMSNLQTATEGEHVRVGHNETLKATAIGGAEGHKENTEIGKNDGCSRFCSKFDKCWQVDRERKRICGWKRRIQDI